jgi:hypothetical protein
LCEICLARTIRQESRIGHLKRWGAALKAIDGLNQKPPLHGWNSIPARDGGRIRQDS